MTNASLPPILEFSPVPVGAWSAQPFRLVSLADMQPFLADIFFFATYHLDSFECEIRRKTDIRGKDSPMTQEEITLARSRLKMLETRSGAIELKGVLERLGDIDVEFTHAEFDNSHSVSLGDMARQLHELRKRIARDLGARMFLTLDVSDAGFYNQEQLFGPDVFTNFWSTRNDVTAAGNCYATGNYTACAFHCARVAEKGLHALARQMNNRFGVVISFGDKEIERVNWGNLIQKIEKEVEKLLDPNRKPRLGPNDVVFYSQTAKEFSYLKNGWRDEVSHSRTFYDQPNDARVFMDHVKTFMTYLAKEGLTE